MIAAIFPQRLTMPLALARIGYDSGRSTAKQSGNIDLHQFFAALRQALDGPTDAEKSICADAAGAGVNFQDIPGKRQSRLSPRLSRLSFAICQNVVD
ncbi:MAG TPA: hypothetical protein VF509_06715 [Sphingobium sp.]